jgi:hypothetical protein
VIGEYPRRSGPPGRGAAFESGRDFRVAGFELLQLELQLISISKVQTTGFQPVRFHLQAVPPVDPQGVSLGAWMSRIRPIFRRPSVTGFPPGFREYPADRGETASRLSMSAMEPIRRVVQSTRIRTFSPLPKPTGF